MKQAAYWGIRYVLGLVFIWASWHKIISPDQFALILYGYDVFPGVLINFLAIFIPFLELVAGGSLVTGLYKRSGLLLILLMLAGFCIIIGFNLLRGHTFDCGCFSYGQSSSAGAALGLLIRDFIMLVAGLLLWRLFRKEVVASA